MKVEENMQTYMNKMKTNLRQLLDTVVDLLNGYCSYMKVFNELTDDFKEHEIYYQWFQRHVKVEDPDESNCLFADFFECVQVRSSSEAFCETIGSVMNNHSGKGRYLRPINFNKEIFLEVNLGPTYMSEKLVKEVFELRKKDYIFKEDGARQLVTRRLVDEKS